MHKRKRKLKRGCGCLLPIIVLALLLIGTYKILGSDWNDTIYNDNNSEEVILQDDETYSTHVILVDLSSNKILYEKASKELTYPASLTKIMTTILAIENIADLDQEIALSESMFNDLYSADTSMAGFMPGEEVKAIDLLYGAMLPSGAEAAEALAINISGSEDGFVELMNEKAKELKMNNTHFANAIGLADPEHYTSARDLAILLEYCLKNDIFRDIFTSSRYATSSTDKHPDGITFYSTMFQSMNTAAFAGGEIIGGKTGYTEEAGLCLASLAEKDGKDYLLVTTGAEGNHETEQYNITDALYIYNRCLP